MIFQNFPGTPKNMLWEKQQKEKGKVKKGMLEISKYSDIHFYYNNICVDWNWRKKVIVWTYLYPCKNRYFFNRFWSELCDWKWSKVIETG